MEETGVPLISVIVPIYNVERYLRKCLDSLRGQTLKKIEFICIDDGSTDNSGRIADEYAREDARFRVIHTENRGLSATRNRGIDESRTEWLMFVDSDDWVASEFCRVPYEAANRENADLVVFRAFYVRENGKIMVSKKSEARDGVVNEMIAHEYGGWAVWNKLFNKSLFDTVKFPNGRVYEDSSTTHKIIHKAKKILLLDDSLYYYVKRRGSITKTHTALNRKDAHFADLERQLDLFSYGYPVEKLNMCAAAISFLSVSTPFDGLLYLRAVEIVEATDCIPKELTLKQKVGLLIWKKNRRLFQLMCKSLGRV